MEGTDPVVDPVLEPITVTAGCTTSNSDEISVASLSFSDASYSQFLFADSDDGLFHRVITDDNAYVRALYATAMTILPSYGYSAGCILPRANELAPSANNSPVDSCDTYSDVELPYALVAAVINVVANTSCGDTSYGIPSCPAIRTRDGSLTGVVVKCSSSIAPANFNIHPAFTTNLTTLSTTTYSEFNIGDLSDGHYTYSLTNDEDYVNTVYNVARKILPEYGFMEDCIIADAKILAPNTSSSLFASPAVCVQDTTEKAALLEYLIGATFGYVNQISCGSSDYGLTGCPNLTSSNDNYIGGMLEK